MSMGTRRIPSGSASAPLPVQTFIRSSYVQQKVPQAAFAIHEYSRQPQAVIRRRATPGETVTAEV